MHVFENVRVYLLMCDYMSLCVNIFIILLFFFFLLCVCVCVCECERERERESIHFYLLYKTRLMVTDLNRNRLRKLHTNHSSPTNAFTQKSPVLNQTSGLFEISTIMKYFIKQARSLLIYSTKNSHIQNNK